MKLKPPGGRPPSRAGLLAGLAVGATALTLVACGGASPSAAPSTTQGHSSTSATPADPTDQVLATYHDMWDDLVTAAETSDYQSPLLSQHASGAALTLLVQGLARDQLHDIVTRGVTAHSPRVTSLALANDPSRATVTDCFDDTHWIEYTTSGGLAKNKPGGRRATTADLVKKDGIWKVSQINIGGTGTC